MSEVKVGYGSDRLPASDSLLDADSASSATTPYPSPAYAWYVVGVLTVAYVFSFIDRQILNLLVVPIQRDLGINDTQIGLLQGIAFAFFYTLMGIPIGRLADRSSRRMIIGIGFFCWSLMTMSCGLARSFLTLFLARMGVGVGEATLSPSAYSMISDYFPPDRVGRAIGVYAGGSFVGAGLAYIVGGFVLQLVSAVDTMTLPWIGELRTWQAAFLIVGFPGVLLAFLVLTIREPERRGRFQRGSEDSEKPVPIRKGLAFLARNKQAYTFHFLGYSSITLVAYAVLAWLPTYFIRVHGWQPGQVGLSFGVIILVFGTVGSIGAGWLADRLRASGVKDANLRIIMFSSLLMMPFVIGESLVDNDLLSMALVAIATLGWSMPMGVGPAALMTITPNQLRSQVSAMYLFMLNIIGLSIGPLAVGLLTDYYFQDPSQVGVSLAIVTGVASLFSALFLYMGLRPYRESVRSAEAGWANI